MEGPNLKYPDCVPQMTLTEVQAQMALREARDARVMERALIPTARIT